VSRRIVLTLDRDFSKARRRLTSLNQAWAAFVHGLYPPGLAILFSTLQHCCHLILQSGFRGLQADSRQACVNAPAASRIKCDCVARLSMRRRLYSASAVLLNARCLSTSVACSSAVRCDPHSIALLGADESRDDEVLAGSMPLFHTDVTIKLRPS